MKEERIEELKRIKASLIEFVKSERFGEWDTNGRKIRDALNCLDIAIKDSESRAEKRYIGVFKNSNSKESLELPFYSRFKSGSYMNMSNAMDEVYRYCEKNNLKNSKFVFIEAYREKN